MIDEQARRHTVADETRREHDLMAQALVTLERALADPAPVREPQWMQRGAAALAVAVDLMRQHVETAEKEGGLVSELELTIGRNRDVRLARSDHRRMLKDSQALLLELCDAAEASVFRTDLRSRTASLIDLVRKHRSRETDLILGTFGLDIGSGD